MKFMKIGSKPDSFKTDGNNARYVENELASDISVNVDGSRFCLHKFPLLSKCACLQKLLSSTDKNNSDEVDISGIPGGPTAFETCAKFCYGMTVTLSAYNVVATRCAAEYLGMHETVEKGNLIYKIDVFLNSSLFRSWKDSIIVLHTTKPFLPLSEDLKLVSLCIDAIASKACVDASHVEWSYTYNRKKLPEEISGADQIKAREVPHDWWVEDLCELEIDYYKRVIMNIKTKCRLGGEVIGEALKAYAYRRLLGFNKGVMEQGDLLKHKTIIETLVWLLPAEKDSVSCGFMLKLLKAVTMVNSGEPVKEQLVRRIGQQLEEASMAELLIKSHQGSETLYDVELVKKIVMEFMRRDQNSEIEVQDDDDGFEVQEVRKLPGILSEASKLMVAKLIDSYLTEIAKDPNLPASKFIDLAEVVTSISRPAHDGLYRAIDMFLKEHPGITKGEKKRMCKMMDCRKLSVEACMHAVQNDRLPLRVVVQVLFFEQVRAAASSGSSTPDLPRGMARELRSCGTYGSSRSVPTVMEDEWEAVATEEEMRALKSEIAALKLQEESGRKSMDKAGATARSKMRSLIKSKKIFGKKLQLQSKGGGEKNNGGGGGGSDSSESLGSMNAGEEAAKTATPSRSLTRRVSVS
ncbi:PREDICTED: BTB/POZ domain-containing protein NPY2 isoform X1 [Camelina sativa]|uniref:BTB/POZ domain-containing protein NPY2 isoform X1 n=1 Tax=Camelina sativa TaxID=90675 RepID=A0ABM0XPE7_CAMSA|nr:PREDICTED: BTB/POZ domain-containing protein NPY2 isoform X1 [Camelina sativa]XP_010488921.1 PREDICTED: BTB/POZ domain-containing protein NPY2 isoform X1 [Camelina sativa]XP_010488922.1 PREDICTED: BTB/POZ domain-containing protein NPY2 isoform X1 [Camelina sativa]XP_019097133.1 PREDICTED: BTB/POZ domain-containing protein NPY2 isoform X1 [Camelina sativa]XP_019097135.1 PREDICTED: BTB/POZ domain-containing protein NPY2 isoform X2 [Camelina sativa]XP_019097136.1 PREDICTED: BTB/POZ domain-cont